MKKKEILVIFILAVLLTGGVWFYPWFKLSCCEAPHYPILYGRGLPVPYYLYFTIWHPTDDYPKLDYISVVLDLLFWFLVLVVGWWVVKKIRQR